MGWEEQLSHLVLYRITLIYHVNTQYRIESSIAGITHLQKLVGFANLGDISQHLLAFEHPNSIPHDQTLAQTMMTFIVRGLFPSYSFPIHSSCVCLSSLPGT